MKKLFLLLLTAFLFIGCSSDDNETIYDYVGTWSGTYEGGDKGVWNFVVDKKGKVSGTMHSDVSNDNFNISGTLNNTGDLVGTVGLPSKGEFKGKLNLDKKANGSWSNTLPTPAQYGTWKGEKEKIK